MRKKNISTSKINSILRQKIEIKQETKVVKDENKKQNLLFVKNQPHLLQDESSGWDHHDEQEYTQEKDQELYEEDEEEEIYQNDDCQDNKKQSGKCQIKQRRNQNSLSVLTQKFIKLIQEQPNQSIDLNFAVQKLKVSKRRIYDITNALQGVNLVQKTKKNIIKWKGHQIFKNKNYATQKYLQLQIQKYTKQILQQLQSQQSLDREIQKQYQQIRELEFTADNIRRGYIDFDFIKSVTKKNQQRYCSQDQKMVFVSAPKGTHLKLIQKGDGAHKLTAITDLPDLRYNASSIKMFILNKQENKLLQYQNKQFREINEDGEFFQFGTINLQLGRIESKYD